MDPNTTLATGPRSGKKKDKTRVTLLFTANSTGADILRPLLINNSRTPRAFHAARITHNTLPVDYYNNKKAWMRHDIFRREFILLHITLVYSYFYDCRVF